LRSDTSPHIAPFALRALKHPELRVAAARRIATADDPGFARRLLDHMWLTADVETARGCVRIGAIPWLRRERKLSDWLDDGQLEGALRLVALSGIKPDDKIEFLARYADHSSPRVRLAAVRCLRRMTGDTATTALEQHREHHDRDIATVVRNELLVRNPTGGRSGGPPSHENDSRLAATDVDSFWQHFERLAPGRRVGVGRQLARSQADLFCKVARRELGALSATQRFRALSIVRDLKLVRDFERDIYTLAHDTSNEVRSLAITIIGNLEGATATRILRQALSDADHRVQSNAIDALSEHGAESWHRALKYKLESSDNRVLASVIRVLLKAREREAAVALIRMLQSPSAAHRVSALWVVQRLELTTLTHRVRALAANDPDPRVRSRAEETLLMDSFVNAWPVHETVEHGADG
jgi:HEAT repeat protein